MFKLSNKIAFFAFGSPVFRPADRLTVAPPTQQSRRLEDVLQAPSKKSVHRVRHDHIEEDTEQLRAS